MATGTPRLAAILFADMVGYSALAQRDEREALRLVGEAASLLRPLLERHRGRQVKSMGDGFLVEFESAVAATECAVALQRSLYERNARAEGPSLEMRVGIHLGDVFYEKGDVLGDAVNIAARIEPLAEASGICISGPVRDLVGNKLPYPSTKLEHAFLKNIETPIAVYSLDLPWHVPSATRVTPWTDRVSELATLGGALDEAARGKGGAVAIAGESGVGKTRLAEETVRHAARRGFRVLRGRGFESELQAPYALWVEAARSFTREAPGPLLYKSAEQCASEIASLVPELKERLGAGTPSPTLDPEAARLRFFEGVTRFFQNLARESPLLVLLDDLQWADAGSLALLEYVVARLAHERALLLLTYRDVEADPEGSLRRALSNLQRARFLREVPLKRFDPENARALVRAILTSERAPGDLVPLVVEKTGGNPFFVEELLRSLLEEGILVRTADGWARKSTAKVDVPSSVRDVLRRRVERVGPEAAEVLTSASVIGGEFDFETLRHLTDLGEDDLLRRVESLLRARLLSEREVASGVSVLRVGDEQIRDVLYGQLSGPRRQRLHAKAAEALRATAGGRANERAAELARHYALANDRRNALVHSIRAGEYAAGLFAYEAAVDHYARARKLVAEQPDLRLRSQVAERLGTLRLFVGGYGDGLPLLEEAATGYERLGERLAAGRLWSAVALFCSTALYDEARSYDALRRGRELLESETPGPDLVRLYELLARRRFWSGALDEARALVARSLALAERVGDPEGELAARLLAYQTATAEDLGPARAGLSRAIELARRSPALEPHRVRYLYRELGYEALLLRGEGPGSLRWFEDALDYYQKENRLGPVMDIRGQELSFAHLTLGRIALAGRMAEETHAYALERYPTPDAPNLTVLGEVSRLRGDLVAAERFFDAGGALIEKTGAVLFLTSLLRLGYLGRLHFDKGDRARGIDLLAGAHRTLRQAGFCVSMAYPRAWIGSILVGACADAGRLDEARDAAADVEGLAATPGLGTPPAFAELVGGTMAETRGDADEAARRIARAADAFAGYAWPYERGHALLRLARVFARARRPDAARDAQGAALDVFREIGATADADRARRADLGTSR